MPEIDIKKVLVDFPYEPYEIQKEYMSKVIECLQNGQNAVLESPTGTGKTLSLLCSSLAWLSAQTAVFQMRNLCDPSADKNYFLSSLENKLTSQTGSSMNSWVGCSTRAPKIVYASRTHSQLAQVMLELKKTSYRYMKVGILGSRDQLCIHPQVSKETNVSAKIHMCKILINERKCVYHNNLEKKINEPLFQEDRLIDIEDLLKKGKQMQCCPYYASRELQKNSQILFTPYNYLLDPKTRRAQDISLQSDVIIFDEGHNIEKMCEESASAQLTSTTVAICISEVTTVMKLARHELEDTSLVIEKNVTKDFDAEQLELLKVLLLTVEKAIDDLELPNDKSKTFAGSYIFTVLSKAEITCANNTTLSGLLDKVSQFLMTVNESHLHQKGAGLAKFGEFLEVVFNSLGQPKSEEYTDLNYKLHVEVETVKPSRGSSAWSNTTPASAGGKILNFWCFNPGFGMRSLANLGVRSIILTSGTLSPLAATISEIGIPVDVQLSNQHIIKPNQICAVVVGKGPGGSELRCVYQNRTNHKYLTDLGQTCLNFYRIMPGGVLVFFPSYPFLKACVEFWKENGIWDKMAAIKSIFIEPQNKDEMKAIMEEYYNMVNERGASLFAVCRGKISEGLDFADDRARAVIVIGLPYPPFNDPKVILKREYLDNGKKKKISSLDGNEWYQLEAMRAINQAIGRVIRHAGDHGAIIFCDCRFSFPNNVKALSTWLQSHIVTNSSFGQALKLVSNFFKSWKDSPAKICYEDGPSTCNSYPKTVTQSVQKLASSSSMSSSTTTDFSKLYGQPSCSKEQTAKLKLMSPSVKRKSVLESLEEEDEVTDTDKSKDDILHRSSISQHEIAPINVIKKRKLLIKRPTTYSSENTEPPSEHSSSSNYKNFVLKLQHNSSPNQMNDFKKAINEYRSAEKADQNTDKFISEMAKLFLTSKNPELRSLFKDIPYFLKTDEDKNRFWDLHYKNINK